MNFGKKLISTYSGVYSGYSRLMSDKIADYFIDGLNKAQRLITSPALLLKAFNYNQTDIYDFAQVADWVYGKPNVNLPNRWIGLNKTEELFPTDTNIVNGFIDTGLIGYQGAFLQVNIQGVEYWIMAHRGTELDRQMIADLASGVSQTLGISPQFNAAKSYYDRFRQTHPNAKVIHIGHSLGGSIAQAFAVHGRKVSSNQYNDYALTFNSAGAWNVVDSWNVNADDYYSYIDNYIAVKDFVPIFMPMVGKNYYVNAWLKDSTAREMATDRINAIFDGKVIKIINTKLKGCFDYHGLHNFDNTHFKYAENLDRYDTIVPIYWWMYKTLFKDKSLGVIDIDFKEVF